MASKNVIAKGTTYNGVESITLPTSPSGTATFYEISDTTATASDVLNSKYFYTASGVKTQGTGTGGSATLITKNITANGTYNASSDSADGYSSVTVSVSGGGGLEYEEGTWIPSENINHPTINFSDSHSTLPFYVAIYDTTNTAHGTNDILYWALINHYGLYGGIAVNTSTTWYGRVQCSYMSGSSAGTSGINISKLTGSSTSCMPYYLATDSFSPGTSSSIFASSRTYKWIAVWAPPTT